MKRQIPLLQEVLSDRKITWDADYPFLYHVQSALLLALREQGRLSPMQHRHAEEKLKKQRRDRARQKPEEP